MHLLLVVVSLFASLRLPVTEWKVQESSVAFKVKNAGLTVNGSFGGLQADIQFDPQNLTESRITASVDVSTIDTGIGARDNHLRKEKYFDAGNYPKITMRSTKLIQTGTNAYSGNFELTIKNTTKKIQLPFTFVKNGNAGTFNGAFELNRLDYQVGESSWLLSDDVRIAIQVTVTP